MFSLFFYVYFYDSSKDRKTKSILLYHKYKLLVLIFMSYFYFMTVQHQPSSTNPQVCSVFKVYDIFVAYNKNILT